MSKQLSEQIVDSILNSDKESFMQQFQAAIAAKVSDALEARKVEVASTLIAPQQEEPTEVVQEEAEQIDEVGGFRTSVQKGSLIGRNKSTKADAPLSDAERKMRLEKIHLPKSLVLLVA